MLVVFVLMEQSSTCIPIPDDVEKPTRLTIDCMHLTY